MRKILLSILIIFFCNTFASSAYTTLESGVELYSEYYPNKDSKFHGTIVFENGSGMALTQWTDNKKFFSCVKSIGNTFFYDRNGLGKSPPDLSTSVTNPITAKMENEKLFKLLQKNHLPLPYVIVGHSYGGMYADYFARKYYKSTFGVLLIDPVPQNLVYSDLFKKQMLYLESWVPVTNKKLYNDHTYKSEVQSGFKQPSAEVFYEGRGITKSREQINSLPLLPNNIPIIILSSIKMESSNTMRYGWFKEQKKYLNKNPKSHAMMLNSGHTIWDKYPDLVCAQLKQIAQ